ncbi:hypothetical protein Gotur_003441 [Gossypium turneri]
MEEMRRFSNEKKDPMTSKELNDEPYEIATSREDGESSDEEDGISTSDDEIGEMRDILVDEQGRTYYNIGTTDDLENLPIPKSVQHKGDNLLEELE